MYHVAKCVKPQIAKGKATIANYRQSQVSNQ